jgi:transposase-like protein
MALPFQGFVSLLTPPVAMKKTCASTFKARLILELLKGEKSHSQLSSEHIIHPNQLRS